MSFGHSKRYNVGGVILVYERIPYVSSVSIGLWVPVGSRYELDEESGYSHFLEHMLFKGTKKRSYKDISAEIDRVGGVLNAATNREYTYYYVSLMSEHIELAMDLLADMFYNSLFLEEEIEKEKAVVIEEIKMYEDTPDEYVFDLFMEYMYANSSLGRSILGNEQVVNAISRDSLFSFYDRYYRNNHIIISVAGNFSEERLLRLVEDFFSPHILRQKTNNVNKEKKGVSGSSSGVYIIEKELGQSHICIGFPAIERASPKRHILYVLSTIIGGNMSSRLFQKLREEKGLCYSAYSFQSLFSDTGIFGIYAGSSNDNVATVLEIIKSEIEDILNGNISEEEVESAKNYLKGNLSLSLENTESRMVFLAKNEITFSKIVRLSDIFRGISNVLREDVISLSQEILSKNPVVVILGKPKKADYIKNIM